MLYIGVENMNKVFKVIWNKAKNCYIVVSELAKNKTKSGSLKKVQASLAAVVMVSSLTLAQSAAADIVSYYTGDGHIMEHATSWGSTYTEKFDSFNVSGIDFSKEFTINLDDNYVRYSGDSDESGNWYRSSMQLYYTPVTYTTARGNTFEAGKLYAVEYNGKLAYGSSTTNAFLLGDAKAILGGNSSELSEEQKSKLTI